jgi:uncharacterized membrane protein YjfL (UPF0719 family)
MNQLSLSLAQLVIAVILSVATAYLAIYLFQRLTRGLDEWEALRQGNAAIGLVLGAIVLSIALVLRPALSLDPAAWDAGTQLFLKGLLAQAIQLVIGLVLAVGSVAIAIFGFAALTRDIDEIAELRNGNMAVAALLASVVVGVGIMVSQGMSQFLHAIAALLF